MLKPKSYLDKAVDYGIDKARSAGDFLSSNYRGILTATGLGLASVLSGCKGQASYGARFGEDVLDLYAGFRRDDACDLYKGDIVVEGDGTTPRKLIAGAGKDSRYNAVDDIAFKDWEARASYSQEGNKREARWSGACLPTLAGELGKDGFRFGLHINGNALEDRIEQAPVAVDVAAGESGLTGSFGWISGNISACRFLELFYGQKKGEVTIDTFYNGTPVGNDVQESITNHLGANLELSLGRIYTSLNGISQLGFKNSESNNHVGGALVIYNTGKRNSAVILRGSFFETAEVGRDNDTESEGSLAIVLGGIKKNGLVDLIRSEMPVEKYLSPDENKFDSLNYWLNCLDSERILALYVRGFGNGSEETTAGAVGALPIFKNRGLTNTGSFGFKLEAGMDSGDVTAGVMYRVKIE